MSTHTTKTKKRRGHGVKSSALLSVFIASTAAKLEAAREHQHRPIRNIAGRCERIKNFYTCPGQNEWPTSIEETSTIQTSHTRSGLIVTTSVGTCTLKNTTKSDLVEDTIEQWDRYDLKPGEFAQGCNALKKEVDEGKLRRRLQSSTGPHYWSPAPLNTACNTYIWRAVIVDMEDESEVFKIHVHDHRTTRVYQPLGDHCKQECGDDNSSKSRSNRPLIVWDGTAQGFIEMDVRVCGNPLKEAAFVLGGTGVGYKGKVIVHAATLRTSRTSCAYVPASNGGWEVTLDGPNCHARFFTKTAVSGTESPEYVCNDTPTCGQDF